MTSDAACSGACCPSGNVTNVKCVSAGSSCVTTYSSNSVTLYGCKNSAAVYSNSNGCTCTAYAEVSQPCSTSTGFGASNCDPTYTFICSAGSNSSSTTATTCLYAAGAVDPGKSCPSNVNTYYSGNPCAASGTACSSTCGTVSTTTGSCSGAGQYCPNSAICNNAGSCVARGGVGTTCGAIADEVPSLECNWNLYCSNGKCQTPFSSSGSCNSIYDCSPGLVCSGGQCQKPSSSSCTVAGTTDDGSTGCGSAYFCDCNGATSGNKGSCITATIPSSVANAINSFLSCMQSSNCIADIYWPLGYDVFQHSLLTAGATPDACFMQSCKNQYQNLLNAISPTEGCGSLALINVVSIIGIISSLLLLSSL